MIPRGKVSTYGDIARVAGLPGHARLVGYALHTLTEGSKVPWHRVVNATGRIVVADARGSATTQALRLIAEGVAVGPGGLVVLKRFRWPSRRRSSA